MFYDGYKAQDIVVDNIVIKRYLNINEPLEDDTSRTKNGELSGLIDNLEKQLGYFSAGTIKINSGHYYSVNRTFNVTDTIADFSLKLSNVLVDSSRSTLMKIKIADEIELSLQKFNVHFPESRYQLKFSSFNLSSYDKELSLSNLSYKPYMRDEDFFRGRIYRIDRFIATITKLDIRNLDFSSFFNESIIKAEVLTANTFLLDALTNMRLPENPEAPLPVMPNNALPDLSFKLDIKKAELKHGTIAVKELYPHDEQPAVLLFSDLYATASPLANNKNLRLDVLTKLTGSGVLKVSFNISLKPGIPRFSYTGELGSMNVLDLNRFLKIADRVEVTEGFVNNVKFNISASGDSAFARATPLYSGLKINELDDETGKATDLVSSFNTFIVNTFVIKKNNPDGNKPAESSSVIYIKEPGDAFMEYVWKALKMAIGEIVGFG